MELRNIHAIVQNSDGEYCTLLDVYQSDGRAKCPHCGAPCFVRRSKKNLLHLVVLKGYSHTNPVCQRLYSKGIEFDFDTLSPTFHARMEKKPLITGAPENDIGPETDDADGMDDQGQVPPSHNPPGENLRLHKFSSLRDLYFAGLLAAPDLTLHDGTSLSDILINETIAGNFFDPYTPTPLGYRAIVAVVESCSPATGWITFSVTVSAKFGMDRVIYFNLYDPFPAHIISLDKQLFASHGDTKEGKRALIYGDWMFGGCPKCQAIVTPQPKCHTQFLCTRYFYHAKITRKGQVVVL